MRLGNNRSANGSPFQTTGPTTENARGTKSTPRSVAEGIAPSVVRDGIAKISELDRSKAQ